MTNRQKILIVLGVALVIVIVPLSVLVGAAVIGYRAATKAGNEAATIQNMKTIAAVEAQYFNTRGRTFATIDQLVREQMLSAKFMGQPPVADGYVFKLKLKSSDSFTLAADPQDRSSGTRHFYLDSASMQVRVNANAPAGPNDPLQ